MVKSGNMDGSSVEFKHHCAQINLIVSSLNPHVCWVYGSYMKLLVCLKIGHTRESMLLNHQSAYHIQYQYTPFSITPKTIPFGSEHCLRRYG